MPENSIKKECAIIDISAYHKRDYSKLLPQIRTRKGNDMQSYEYWACRSGEVFVKVTFGKFKGESELSA